ncbi:translation initiation factor IF-3 [Ureaplasma canigenitalium]|uniref:translation initiation factor IF-3 n=1 Tax=Ureaplasma canigenitalium TaxID=42092 RepID=UPI0004E1B67F|nr:translation initiation factor IF-3 [Ureaplasma canigenitalium]
MNQNFKSPNISNQTTNNNNNQDQKRPNREIPMINENIRARTVFVIDDEGNNLGEMNRNDALLLAQSKGLDLVLIAKKGNSLVTKILDYGKFKYDQKRRQKESKKKQTIIKVKEIKIKPMIGDHDLSVRVENAKKWLTDKNVVKFIIEARGRMSTKDEFIQQSYEKFINNISDYGTVTQANKRVSNFRYETIIEPLKSNNKEGKKNG